MKSWLYPGAKVVCVDGYSDRRVVGRIKAGRVYTVRAIGRTYLGNLGVRLEEVVVRSATGGWKYDDGSRQVCNGDIFVKASRFRPLTKRSTDTEVSKLKRLLNTTPADLEKVDG